MGVYVAASGWRNGSMENCKTERGHGIQESEAGIESIRLGIQKLLNAVALLEERF